MSTGAASGAESAVPSARQGLLPVVFLVGLGVIWGGTMPLARFAVTEGFPPVAYSLWGVLGAGVLVLFISFLRGNPPPLKARYLGFAVIAGIIQFAVPNAVMYTALQHITAGTSVLAVATTSMMAYVISLLIGWERFSPIRCLGLLTGLSGIAVIFLPRIGSPESGELFWLALSFVTPFCYACGNLLLGHFRPAGVQSMPLAGALMVGGGLFLLPIAYFVGDIPMIWPPFEPVELAAFATITVSALGFVGLTELIHRTGAVFGSQVVYLVTVFAVLYGMAFLGERHSWHIWVALPLILAGVALVHRHGSADHKSSTT